MQDLKTRKKQMFRERAKAEFGKLAAYSTFLDASMITSYSASIAIPTASVPAVLDIDEQGNLI